MAALTWSRRTQNNCVCNRSRGGGHLLALRFGTRRITPGLSANWKLGTPTGLLLGVRQLATRRRCPQGRVQTICSSVFVWQKKGRHASVGFRDAPDLHTRAERVRGKQTPAVLEAEFVLASVVLIEFSPVASQVSLQKRER